MLSVSAPDCQTEDNIYEELPKDNLQSSEPIIGKKNEIETFSLSSHLDIEVGEEYDHLDFNRPLNELKAQYLSTETIKSVSDRSRNSSSRESPDTSLGSQPDSDMNLCDAVLGSFEKLNQSQSRSRKTLYQPYGP